MLGMLQSIILENVKWRNQIGRLALFDLQKTVRGAVLGWLWLFVKPITYISVFWFALEIGLRANRSIGDFPFLLWLACGLIPWFFMSDMLGGGSNVYKRYAYLITRVSFPSSVIPSLYSVSCFIIFAISLVALIAGMYIGGFPLTIYALQIPFIAIVMLLFFVLFSLMTSPLAAISKDIANLLKAVRQPIFWLSGIIFNTSTVGIPWLQWFFAFNPVSFFATAFRAALCEKYWLWERPEILICFGLVFALTLICALQFHRRLGWEVADAL
ncbi:MAG: ABC transporter permease [Coriobacteriales bacterium]|jgi:teichoic acid transport system permease protein|nr:ABC transporter permease [Coriobacteriales bacterium]